MFRVLLLAIFLGLWSKTFTNTVKAEQISSPSEFHIKYSKNTGANRYILTSNIRKTEIDDGTTDTPSGDDENESGNEDNNDNKNPEETPGDNDNNNPEEGDNKPNNPDSSGDITDPEKPDGGNTGEGGGDSGSDDNKDDDKDNNNDDTDDDDDDEGDREDNYDSILYRDYDEYLISIIADPECILIATTNDASKLANLDVAIHLEPMIHPRMYTFDCFSSLKLTSNTTSGKITEKRLHLDSLRKKDYVADVIINAAIYAAPISTVSKKSYLNNLPSANNTGTDLYSDPAFRTQWPLNRLNLLNINEAILNATSQNTTSTTTSSITSNDKTNLLKTKLIDINLGDAHKNGYTGSGIRATLIDAGIDIQPIDISENFKSKTSFSITAKTVKSMYNTCYTPDPSCGVTGNAAGTGHFGLIAATRGNKHCGTGVAPNCSISIRSISLSPRSMSIRDMATALSTRKRTEKMLSFASLSQEDQERVTSGKTLDFFYNSASDTDIMSIFIEYSQKSTTETNPEQTVDIGYFDEDIPALANIVREGTLHPTKQRENMVIEGKKIDNSDSQTVDYSGGVVYLSSAGSQSTNSFINPINRIPGVIVISSLSPFGVLASYSNCGYNVYFTAPSSQRLKNPDDKKSIKKADFIVNNSDYIPPFAENEYENLDEYDKAITQYLDYAGLTTSLPNINSIYGESCGDSFYGAGGALSHASGAVALILQTIQKNTKLAQKYAGSWSISGGYRDILHILIQTSKNDIDISKGKWLINADGNRYSPYYGFGLIDVDAAINFTSSITELYSGGKIITGDSELNGGDGDNSNTEGGDSNQNGGSNDNDDDDDDDFDDIFKKASSNNQSTFVRSTIESAFGVKNNVVSANPNTGYNESYTQVLEKTIIDDLVPDSENNPLILTFKVADTSDKRVEVVSINVDVSSQAINDLSLSVISPEKTEIVIIDGTSQRTTETNSILVGTVNSDQMMRVVTFTTPAFMGERSAGQWKISLKDKHTGNRIMVHSARLTIYGVPQLLSMTSPGFNERIEFTNASSTSVPKVKWILTDIAQEMMVYSGYQFDLWVTDVNKEPVVKIADKIDISKTKEFDFTNISYSSSSLNSNSVTINSLQDKADSDGNVEFEKNVFLKEFPNGSTGFFVLVPTSYFPSIDYYRSDVVYSHKVRFYIENSDMQKNEEDAAFGYTNVFTVSMASIFIINLFIFIFMAKY